MADTDKPMSTKSVSSLAAYLAGVMILAGYTILALWSPQPPAPTGNAPQPSCVSSGPKLTNIHPYSVSVGSVVDVLVIGCAFPSSTEVKVNGSVRQALVVDSSHIRVGLTAGDLST